MLNIKKTLLIRAISLLLSISIALPSTVYSLPENQSNALRVPLDKNYNRIKELLTIYSDFGGTIAVYPAGSHEEVLRDLVAEEIKDVNEREDFKNKCAIAYALYQQRRKDSSLSIGERYAIWLEPFVGKLHERHFDSLVKDWEFNDKFLLGAASIKEQLGYQNNQLFEPIIVSGALSNLIWAYLERPDIAKRLLDNQISIKKEQVQGVMLIVDEKGYFQGQVKTVGKMFYTQGPEFPENSIVIGDAPMEGFGFGTRLINVESFVLETAKHRIRDRIDRTKARMQSAQSFTMANIWSMLLGNEEARIGELKGKITWQGSNAGKTQDKFEHTQMLVEFEKDLDINRGDIEVAKAVVLNRKDSSLSGLDGSKIEEFLKYYYNISQEELKILRFAIVLHDLGGIYGRGEDAFAGRELSEPILARFVKEGLIIEEEKKVILALIYLHTTFNTMHFGEAMPIDIKRYLEKEGVNKELYFKLAPILYIADVGSVGEGKISDGHLSNAIFMSKEENILSLINNWDKLRLFLGFCGRANIVMDFTQVVSIEEPEYLEKTLKILQEIDKEGYDYLFNVFLANTASFGGHAVFIFRYLNEFSKPAKDNTLIKLLYLLALLHRQNPTFNYILFTPVKDRDFAEALHILLNRIDIAEIAWLFTNKVSFQDLKDKVGIAAKLDGQILVINSDEILRSVNLLRGVLFGSTLQLKNN